MFLYIGMAAAAAAAAVIVNREEGLPSGSRGGLLRRSCLVLIALILIVPAVLRQETGNDYLRYVEFFHLASIDAYVPTEPGFNLLAKAVYALCGYENYLLIFGIYAVLTVLLMLAALRQQAENFAFSFFLFMMFGYYYQSYNTMRYYLALSIALAAMTCLLRRRIPAFVLLILTASLFHKSALAALLLYPLAAHRWRRVHGMLAVGLGAAVLVLHERVLQLLVALYPSWEGTEDLAAGTSVSWVNILRCGAVLVLAGLVRHWSREAADGGRDLRDGSRHAEVCGAPDGEGSAVRCTERESFRQRQLRMYINGNFLALLVHIFGWFIPEVSRLCYYLTFTQVFLFPMLLRRIPEEEPGEDGAARRPLRQRCSRRKVLTLLVIAAAVMYYLLFLRTAYRDTIKILPYKSFLFHELNQTPSGSVG